MELADLKLEVTRMHLLDGTGATKAFCDISIADSLVVNGLRIIEGKDGLFVSMPREEGKDGKWYTVVVALKREVKEEVGIEINNVEYVTSLATVHADGSPSLVISCVADYVFGEINLQVEENDQFACVSLEESKNYKLLDGIYDELVMVENKRKGKKTEWQRFN